ncbi:hypothetical protein OG21DRAFT_1440519 [Imleria badia]|nr:hypothetical protein OG21DRAFT_1440519 [Imleria badia]
MPQSPVSRLEVCIMSFYILILGPTLTHMLGMHKSNEGCSQVLEATTTALNEEALQMLLISTQEVNIALCVRYAVQQLLRDVDKVHSQAHPLAVASISKLELQRLAWWFPRVW